MDIKEKLRLAALQAEKDKTALIPPDSEIDWTPSENFGKRMDEIIGIKPNRRKLIIRRLFIAAAVAALISVLLVPVFIIDTDDSEHINVGTDPDIFNPVDISDTSITDTLDESDETDDSENTSEDVSVNQNESDMNNDESAVQPDESEESKSPDNGILNDPPPGIDIMAPSPFAYRPDYVPPGYENTENSITSEYYLIIYSNGSDVIRLYYLNSETDFSIIDELKKDHNDLDYYSRVPKSVNITADSSSDRLTEYALFPDTIEWNQNNVAWNSSGKTFAVMGNSNISQEEIEKMALSVNTEPKE